MNIPMRNWMKIVVSGFLFCAASQTVNAETYHFVDPDSRVVHATIAFDGVNAGRVYFLERWCSHDGSDCAAGGTDIPASYEHFFSLDQPTSFDITTDTNLWLGIEGRGTAAFGNVSEKTVFRVFDLVRDGVAEILPPPEGAPVRELNLGAVGINLPVSVKFPREDDGYGAIIELPAGWCGQSSGVCAGTSVEIGQVLHKWVRGETSESEPFFYVSGDFDFELMRKGDELSLLVNMLRANGPSLQNSFSVARVANATAQQTHSFDQSSFDCTPATEVSVGGHNLHIIRELDGACIGSISEAVIPDPNAIIRLANEWCGMPSCRGVEANSGSYKKDGSRPLRFWEGQTNGPSITIKVGTNGFEEPVVISSRGERVIARIVHEYRSLDDGPAIVKESQAVTENTYRIAELPKPLGIYALVEGRSDLAGLGNIGENLCLIKPTVFSGGGRIYFKELGAPVDGNPYHIARYLECSTFGDEPENCVMHEGTPDAPNPVAAFGGFNYTPIGDGHFKACLPDNTKECALVYACVRPGSEVNASRTFPSGGNMSEAILDAPSGPLNLRYIDDNTIRIR